MTNNSSGKVITIFVVITALLLLTITAISLFYLKVENEERKLVEAQLKEVSGEKAKLEVSLQEVQKQNYLLEEKNKEADDRINSLLDELELEKGLREEVKSENTTIKKQLDEAVKEKERIRQKLTNNIMDLEQKVVDLETKLNLEIERSKELQQKSQLQHNQTKTDEEKVSKADGDTHNHDAMASEQEGDKPQKVELEQIVVNPELKGQEVLNISKTEEFVPASPQKIPEGRVLSVDIETEFVVVNLGAKDGIVEDMFMSVYRGPHYLGDIKITRVQPEMSAADLIPPFSSQMVRKNDQVVAK